MKTVREDLIKRLKPLMGQPGIYDMCTLLENEIEQWKEELITAKGNDIYALQGAILKLKCLLLDLKRDIKIQDYRNGAYNAEIT
jgi:hypothetical protein